MPRLQAITIDGTVIEADKMKAKKKGVKLQREGKKKPETIGYVPNEKLMYVIPESVTHNIDELEDIPA